MKPLTTALILVVIITAAGILLGGQPSPPQPPTPAGHAPVASAPSATEPSTPGTPNEPHADGFHEPEEPAVVTPSHDGGEHPDWTVPTQDRRLAVDTATQFIAAWLQPDAQLRTQALTPVAAAALADELANPRLRTWTATPTDAPTIVEMASTNAMLRQQFTDGRAVDILLIAEPGTATGWIVTDIAPTRTRP